MKAIKILYGIDMFLNELVAKNGNKYDKIGFNGFSQDKHKSMYVQKDDNRRAGGKYTRFLRIFYNKNSVVLGGSSFQYFKAIKGLNNTQKSIYKKGWGWKPGEGHNDKMTKAIKAAAWKTRYQFDKSAFIARKTKSGKIQFIIMDHYKPAFTKRYKTRAKTVKEPQARNYLKAFIKNKLEEMSVGLIDPSKVEFTYTPSFNGHGFVNKVSPQYEHLNKVALMITDKIIAKAKEL